MSSVTVSYGQKFDYVITHDSIYREGKILGLPSENNRTVTFRLSAKVPPQELGIDSVNEFSFKNRKFFRKQSEKLSGNKPVFLEFLSEDAHSNKLWKLNADVPLFFIESEEEIIQLDENYQRSLASLMGGYELNQLILITPMKEYPLKYLFETAKTIQKPRTFTKSFLISPHIGLNLINLEVWVPGLDRDLQVTNTSFSFGINTELFLNFERNISVNLNPTIVFVQASEFDVFVNGQERIETDLNITMNLLQVPLTVKYYLDIHPNVNRVFFEGGYVLGKALKNSANSAQGRIIGNEVFTSKNYFELPNIHQGFVLGIGFEKYLRNRNPINLGSRASILNGATTNMKQLQFFVGYKF